MESENLANNIIVPIRLVRSFEYRNIQHVAYKDISPSMLGKEFLQMILNDIKTRSGLPPPFRNFKYDTLKIEHKPHGAKTNDPVISTERDEELLIDLDKSLNACGIENETELSLFKMEDYLQYKKSKIVKW
ncbi:UPF0538 protein C2orf76 homolog [Apostichopus japonicus]|uniref:UPF0538 protein C2orf76 homolog n=1 Tax=Stichopus japonicus TaxID=307972 RepID=UPI003AB31B09